jgi:capsular exopolysaccharide synthesis family protein
MATQNKIKQSRLKKSQQEESSSFLNIMDIVGLCISNWFWFVICLAVTWSAALIYLRMTPPVFTRSTSIAVKEDANNQALNDIFSRTRYGRRNSSTTLYNEMITLKKPGLMSKVVDRLNLEYEYQIRGKLRNTTLYGTSLPVIVDDKYNADGYGLFTLDVRDANTVKITCKNGDTNKVYKVAYGKPVNTVIGMMAINKTPAFSARTNDIITVTKRPKSDAAAIFLGKLSVYNSVEESSVIDISMTDVNIERADDILNTLIAVYNEQWIENRNEVIVATNKFINERLTAIEQELGDVESELSDYQISNHTLNSSSEGARYMGRALEYENQGEQYENELAMVKYYRGYVSAIKDRNQPLALPTGINSGTLSGQVGQYNSLVMQRTNIISASTEANPLITDIDRQLGVLQRSILVTIDNHVATINTQLKMLHINDEKNNAKIAATPSKQKQYVDIERRRKIKEQLYTFLLQTREQNQMNQAFAAYNTRVLQPAGGSNRQSFPDNNKIKLIALGLGLGLPLAFIILREWLNSKVRGRRDVEKLSVPFVGELPQIEFPDETTEGVIKEFLADTAYKWEKFKGKLTGKHVHHRRKDKLHKGERVVVKHGSRNVINEAFRVLRTNVEFIIGQDKEKNVIMTTSANPGSGKTFISYNLALCMSLKKKKTLAIDLDLRRRNLSVFVDRPEVGLSDYINGTVNDWHDLLVQSKESEYMYVLPVGTLPPNPAEILAYDKFAKLVSEVRKEFDYVFFDCPPVEIVADTSIIAKYADITLFVIRVGLMELEFLNVIEEYYEEQKYNNIGIILNGTLTANSRYGYRRYGYRYGYGYGYGYGGYGYYGSGYSTGYGEGYSSK